MVVDPIPSSVPEILHEPLRTLAAADLATALAFFRQEGGGRTGVHEIVLSTETRRDEGTGAEVATSHIVLKLDFGGGTWKRVRKKASQMVA